MVMDFGAFSSNLRLPTRVYGAIAALTCATMLLTACKTAPVGYFPQPVSGDRVQGIIEQVFMEQDPKYRPEGIAVRSEYLEFGQGVVSTSRGGAIAVEIAPGVAVASGRSTTSSKHLVTRLYYRSIGQIRIWYKNRRFIVDVRDADNGRYSLLRVYARKEASAVALANALNCLKDADRWAQCDAAL